MKNPTKQKINYEFNPEPYSDQLLSIFDSIQKSQVWDDKTLHKILKKHPKDGSKLFSRDQLLAGYNLLVKQSRLKVNPEIQNRIKMKPIRTISGVATVTVLTKPFPCPGKCIFCPNDVKMPKSYLSDEPGAQRAEMNNFDPYLQTYNRINALKNIGHNVEKIELIVLGGTWSFYPESYQIWFIKECFRAMNEFGKVDSRSAVLTENEFINADEFQEKLDGDLKKNYNYIIQKVTQGEHKGLLTKRESATWEELFEQHRINETAHCKNVGLVIETRPDYIDEKEIIKLRKLGATKIQIGIQSLNDKVMGLNKRGHGRKETENAIKLLRRAGFKIHAHWMANLYGSNVEDDIADYSKLWEESIRPDELKIYPASIIKNTELNDLYEKGEFQPYSYDQLLYILKTIMPETPRYCRLTRIIRDIPSTDIVAGNKLTNFRQIAEDKINKEGEKCNCIRCREVKNKEVSFDDLELEIIEYMTEVSKEYFLSYKTKADDKIAGFLRLSIPDKKLSEDHFIEELKDKAIIREIHVYGQVVGIGKKDEGKSQHLGLGTKLIEKAKEISKENGFETISVISAIGTREYYQKKGFYIENLYMHRAIH